GIIGACKALWNKINNPDFRAALSSLVLQLAEADQAAKLASREIRAALPKALKRSALTYAREICVVEKKPLTLLEIEARIRAAGYVTRSPHFANYLSRVLRSSRAFVEVSRGVWSLRAAAEAAA